MYIPLVNNNRRLPNGGVFNPVTLNLYAYANNNPMKYVDPNGLWADDVHLGMTEKWVTSILGKDQADRAKNIAVANNAVDNITGGKSYLPFIGDPSWHFNTNSSGIDSREQHKNECLSEAIGFQLKANEYAKNGNSILALMFEGLADTALGQGLHALQDIYAHTDKYVTCSLGVCSHEGPKAWGEKAEADNPIKDPSRIQETERATREYVDKFNNATKEDIYYRYRGFGSNESNVTSNVAD